METMQPALKNGRNLWDGINMPFEEFQRRIHEVRDKMAELGIDMLLAYGHAFDDYGNYCYLSNYMIRLPRGSLVALSREDVALFFEGASRGLPSAKRLTWVEDVRPGPDISKECIKYLEEKSLATSTVGLAGLVEWMPYEQWKYLHDSLKGCTFLDAQGLMRDMRMIKSKGEMDQIRRASRITKIIFEKLEGSLRSKPDERALEAFIIREARLEGAEDVRVLFGKPGQDNWAFHPGENIGFQAGETLIIYLALVYERYWSEAAKTFKVEDSALVILDLEKQETLYSELAHCLQPGKAICDCYQDIMAKIEARDLDFIPDYGLGRGIGLSPREWPLLNQDEAGFFKQGMCFSLRICIRDQDLGAIMIGNTLALTDKGLDVLTA